MINPLPTIESACSLLQQEESQRDVLSNPIVESTALYNKGVVKDKCNICGYKWHGFKFHPPEKCWEKIGYPSWHYKFKQLQAKSSGPIKHKSTGIGNVKKMTASVDGGHIMFTSKQFEQLLKSLPQPLLGMNKQILQTVKKI